MTGLDELAIKLENRAKKMQEDARTMLAKAEVFYEIINLIKEETPQIQIPEPPKERETPLSPYNKPMPYTPHERYETQRLNSDHYNKTWTKADIEYLLTLTEKGYEDKKISELMGRSPGSIAKKRNTMGIKKYKTRFKRQEWNKTDLDMLKGMHINGFTPEQIATRLRRSYSSIANKIFRLQTNGEL